MKTFANAADDRRVEIEELKAVLIESLEDWVHDPGTVVSIVIGVLEQKGLI